MRRRFLAYGALVLLTAVAVVVRVRQLRGDDEEDVRATRAEQARVNYDLFPAGADQPVLRDGHMLVSQLPTQAQFESDVYARWAAELEEPRRYHNKQWQYVFILQALHERGLLTSGKRGAGFGVGQEPLPSLFAKHGVEVLATDLELDKAVEQGWAQSAQHMSSLAILNQRGIATPAEFARLVKGRNVDMNEIPADLRGFDFVWSTCSLGHIGGLEKGLKFIESSLDVLEPGGVAVHTTELNLTSDTDTYESPGTVVYRKRDIDDLVRRLTAQGHEIRVNYHVGNRPFDAHVDQPPYSDLHIKLRIDRYAVTPIGLIIRKRPARS